MSDDSNAIKIANDSGFPLQIVVETIVTKLTKSHGWKVRFSEHSWANRKGSASGFIDLVLEDKHGSTYLVLECKRKNETWVFMRTDGTAKTRKHAKAWATHYREETLKRFGWEDVTPDPACPEASSCAVRGMSANDKTTMLERIGGELIEATEAFAREQRDFRRSKQETIRFYFNVIVTTAQLKIVKFAPESISLEDGTFADAEVVDVPFVRFRKQLSSRAVRLTHEQFENGFDPAYERENTVFVVRASELLDFLQQFELSENDFLKFAHES